MKEITFNQFVQDFNEYYNEDYRIISLNINSLSDAMDCIYNSDEFEVDYDREIIEIY